MSVRSSNISNSDNSNDYYGAEDWDSMDEEQLLSKMKDDIEQQKNEIRENTNYIRELAGHIRTTEN